MGREDFLKPESRFFFTKKFTPICASKLIIKYFRKHGLDLGSTGMRKLYEMESESLHREGLISNDQRQSVHNLVGHSKTTAKKYYHNTINDG
jgi:hypothetical protein